MKKRLTGLFLILPLLLIPLGLSCAAGGGLEPIEIDLSARKTPTAAPAIAAPTPTPAATAVAPSTPRAVTTPAASAAPPAAVDNFAVNLGPEQQVVQARIDAFNRHDLDALVSTYAPDARVYDPPDRVRDAGTDGIRAALARELASAGGALVSRERLAQGSFVVERETRGAWTALVVYEVRAGRIANVWILR